MTGTDATPTDVAEDQADGEVDHSADAYAALSAEFGQAAGEVAVDPDDDTQDQGDDEPEDEPSPSSASREAARWRVRFREADSERVDLTNRLERLQHAEIIRLAGEDLAAPEDIFDVGGLDLADVLDDDGDVDHAEVEAVIHTLLSTRPGLRKQAAPRRTSFPDLGGGQRGGPPHASKSWASVLRNEE
jgi:hypothetical protein